MRTYPVEITAPGAVVVAGAILEGMFVASTSSGTLKIYHGTSTANLGTPFSTGTITPASVGYYNLGSWESTAGVYVDTAGLNIVFLVREADL